MQFQRVSLVAVDKMTLNGQSFFFDIKSFGLLTALLGIYRNNGLSNSNVLGGICKKEGIWDEKED